MLEEGFPGGSDGKESIYNAGDLSSIPGLGRPPGGGHGNPRQCSCLENPVDRGAGCGPQGHRELDVTGATSHAPSVDSQCCVPFRCT